jgi:hypothetical protein
MELIDATLVSPSRILHSSAMDRRIFHDIASFDFSYCQFRPRGVRFGRPRVQQE